MKKHLGRDVRESILFMHAIEAVARHQDYGVGKRASLKKHMSSQIFIEQKKYLTLANSTLSQIVETGEKNVELTFLNVYSLEEYTHTQSHSLPPTTATVRPIGVCL